MRNTGPTLAGETTGSEMQDVNICLGRAFLGREMPYFFVTIDNVCTQCYNSYRGRDG
jgi:hypothetical protein